LIVKPTFKNILVQISFTQQYFPDKFIIFLKISTVLITYSVTSHADMLQPSHHASIASFSNLPRSG